jgi:hypothetical protein
LLRLGLQRVRRLLLRLGLQFVRRLMLMLRLQRVRRLLLRLGLQRVRRLPLLLGLLFLGRGRGRENSHHGGMPPALGLEQFRGHVLMKV